MTETQSHEVQQRLTKLERFKQRGVLPYPSRVKRSHDIAEAMALYQPETGGQPTEEVQFHLAGRLMSVRVMGKSTFAHLEDGSGRLQLYLQKDALGDEAYDIFRRDFDVGDFVAVTGVLFTTRSGEITLRVSHYELAAKALHPLPEKWHGLKDMETRHRQRYLDLIANPEARDVFIKRTKIVSAMRRYLDEAGFLEVETPALQPVYGGALARPFTTYHHTLDTTLYLRISDELYLKRLIVGGLDKVYEICKDFRNEGVSTRHNPEFTMMECYWAYADYADMMRLTEEMVAEIAQEALGTTQITYQGHEIDLTPPWRRLSLTEALRQATEIDIDVFTELEPLWAECQRLQLKTSPQPSWGKLVEALLSDYVEPELIQPAFIHTYPLDISPFSKQCPDKPRLVERFELFIAGREIGNAYSELNDPLAQRERFESLKALAEDDGGATHPVDEDYVTALMYGMPPTGGLGIGVDRLVMLLTNQASIREVILFPTLRARG